MKGFDDFFIFYASLLDLFQINWFPILIYKTITPLKINPLDPATSLNGSCYLGLINKSFTIIIIDNLLTSFLNAKYCSMTFTYQK